MTIRRLVPATAVAALAIAAPASAAQTPIGGGATTLKLDRSTAKVLTQNGVGIAPVKPAAARGGGIVFPVSGGKVDLRRVRGHIDHRGGLRLTAGRKALVVRNPVIRLKARSDLTVAVGKARVPLLNLNLSNAKVSRAGVDYVVSRVRGTLTGTAAKALNTTFGVHLFRKGIPIGTASVRISPAQLALARGSTSLKLSKGAADALTSLGVAASPLAPASVRGGALAFPITGGSLNARTLAGSITHSGGIRLAAGSTQVDLRNFTIRIKKNSDLTAQVGGARLAILNLDLSKAKITSRGRSLRVSGVVGKLTSGAASALNAAFNVTAFTPGFELGTATVNARVR